MICWWVWLLRSEVWETDLSLQRGYNMMAMSAAFALIHLRCAIWCAEIIAENILAHISFILFLLGRVVVCIGAFIQFNAMSNDFWNILYYGRNMTLAEPEFFTMDSSHLIAFLIGQLPFTYVLPLAYLLNALLGTSASVSTLIASTIHPRHDPCVLCSIAPFVSNATLSLPSAALLDGFRCIFLAQPFRRIRMN